MNSRDQIWVRLASLRAAYYRAMSYRDRDPVDGMLHEQSRRRSDRLNAAIAAGRFGFDPNWSPCLCGRCLHCRQERSVVAGDLYPIHGYLSGPPRSHQPGE